MLAFDEPAFEKIFSAAAIRFGIYGAMIQVIYPFLHKVGLLWSVSKTAPVQEHFASNIIKRKLMAAIDGLLPGSEKATKFLLFLPPGELHETGLLLANYMIRARGFETIYLGQDVPVQNIEKIVPMVRPSHMLLFYVSARPQAEIVEQVKQYSKIDKQTKVLVAGSNGLIPELKTAGPNTTYLTEVEALLSFLK